jgi:hypothetical protein
LTPDLDAEARPMQRTLPIDAPLYVVAVVSNPARFASRYRLYRDFARHATDSGAELFTVELAYGERPFEVTEAGNPRHVRFRTRSEIWHKENLINLGIARLPSDWKYVAWVDADLQFARPDWVQETLQRLQHSPIVQMWSHALDLGPDNEPIQSHVSFGYCHVEGVPYSLMPGPGYYAAPKPGQVDAYHWHPGFAWAARREAIDHLGGLIDWAILGAADMHMAKALIGRAAEQTPAGIHPGYTARLRRFQDRAEKHIRRDVGYVPGLIAHYWHGKKKDRRYWDRWKILVENRFDPDHDIKPDNQGVLQLVDHGDARSIALRDQCRQYFARRNEDSIDL